MDRSDVLIVGAGPVGLSLALALSNSGRQVGVVDARAPGAAGKDPRTLALSHGTRLTLEQLGVWGKLATTAIDTIHVSHEGGFGRTMLRASEERVPALGYVVSAGDLATALYQELAESDVALAYGAEVTAGECSNEEIQVSCVDPGTKAEQRKITTKLLVCAEGGLSAKEADIVERDYRQHALIAMVGVEGGHHHTAFERFTPEGPIALLPCKRDYALVHVVSPTRADTLINLDEASYLNELQGHLGGRVRLSRVGERVRYPLQLRYRKTTIAPRTVWIGNAAQTLHPVAGQGFNLAMRDIFVLADCLSRNTSDPGDHALLSDYSARRKLDRSGTIRFTDLLARAFSNDCAPLRHLRGGALLALDLAPPLRSFVARRMMFGARAWP